MAYYFNDLPASWDPQVFFPHLMLAPLNGINELFLSTKKTRFRISDHFSQQRRRDFVPFTPEIRERSTIGPTMVQKSHELRCKYWATCSPFAHSLLSITHLFAPYCLLCLRTPLRSAALIRLPTRALQSSWENGFCPWNGHIDFIQFQPTVHFWRQTAWGLWDEDWEVMAWENTKRKEVSDGVSWENSDGERRVNGLFENLLCIQRMKDNKNGTRIKDKTGGREH